jgi:hypothetical protein
LKKIAIFALSLGIYAYIFSNISRVQHHIFEPWGFEKLVLCAALLFILQWLAYRLFFVNDTANPKFSYFCLAYIALQTTAFFHLPGLSDDFYRFFLDGKLLAKSINPYQYTPQNLPADILKKINFAYFYQLNSAQYYSVYPPINQVFFAFAALFAPSSIFIFVGVVRCFLVIFNVWAAYIMYRIQPKAAFLYLFNPLLTLETTANLHFEGVYTALLLAAIYSFTHQKATKSSIYFALSVGTKLVPLLILPLLVIKKKGVNIGFLGLVAFFLCVLFGILSIQNAQNILQSTRLYYGNFEFNASVFYVLRWLGTMVVGYDLVKVITPILGIFVVLFVVHRAHFHSKNIWLSAWWCFVVYVLLAAVVHPWYVLPVLGLGLVAGVVVPSVVLSFGVLLSYSAYNNIHYNENSYYIFIEYTMFFLALMWHFFWCKYAVKRPV